VLGLRGEVLELAPAGLRQSHFLIPASLRSSAHSQGRGPRRAIATLGQQRLAALAWNSFARHSRDGFDRPVLSNVEGLSPNGFLSRLFFPFAQSLSKGMHIRQRANPQNNKDTAAGRVDPKAPVDAPRSAAAGGSGSATV